MGFAGEGGGWYNLIPPKQNDPYPPDGDRARSTLGNRNKVRRSSPVDGTAIYAGFPGCRSDSAGQPRRGDVAGALRGVPARMGNGRRSGLTHGERLFPGPYPPELIAWPNRTRKPTKALAWVRYRAVEPSCADVGVPCRQRFRQTRPDMWLSPNFATRLWEFSTLNACRKPVLGLLIPR